MRAEEPDVRDVTAAAHRLATELSTDGPASALDAVTAAQELTRMVEQLLRLAVDRARAAGHTWQELGEVLGTSRQAAFQRFGRPIDPRTGTPMAEVLLPGATDRALELLGDLIEHRWQRACRDFDDTMAAQLGAERLAAVWAGLIGMIGRFERIGQPRAYPAGDYTIVDTPLSFEAGELTGRITYTRAGKVAGLRFVPPGLFDSPRRARPAGAGAQASDPSQPQ